MADADLLARALAPCETSCDRNAGNFEAGDERRQGNRHSQPTTIGESRSN